MARKVGIVGAGVTPFKGRWVEKTYYELAQMAAMSAMQDAGLEPADVDAAFLASTTISFRGHASPNTLFRA